MFEGAEHRPSGPKVAHRKFTQAFEWSGEAEDAMPTGLQVTATAWVDTEDAHRLLIHTAVSPRQALTGVELTLTRGGARARIAMAPLTGPVRWQDDPQVVGELDGLAFRGVKARDFLNGAVPVEAPPGVPVA
jgi:hypothetical protein